MDKREMVKAILDRGLLISPDMLDGLNEDTLHSIMQDSARKEHLVLKPFTMGAERPEKKEKTTQPAAPAQPVQSAFSIRIRHMQKKDVLGPGDFVGYYNSKYEGIRNMLLKKTSATSINKTGNNTLPATVIGMVREMTNNGFVLEDPTGETEVICSEKGSISEDDVIAVSGYVRNNKFICSEIALPDVPLTHPVSTTEGTLLLAESMPGNTQTDIICSPDSIIETAGGKKMPTPNPAWIEITRGGKTILLLVYKPRKAAGLLDGIGMLKKRHLYANRDQIVGPNDQFLLESIPDILWLVSAEKGTRTYKGVTLVCCGNGSAARVDLSTRKVEFVSL